MRPGFQRMRIPRLQKVTRHLVDGTSRAHWYFRPTRKKLPAPTDPGFQEAYEAAEREFAETQQIAHSSSFPEQRIIASFSTGHSSCGARKRRSKGQGP